jgi:hypothetical protein
MAAQQLIAAIHLAHWKLDWQVCTCKLCRSNPEGKGMACCVSELYVEHSQGCVREALAAGFSPCAAMRNQEFKRTVAPVCCMMRRYYSNLHGL